MGDAREDASAGPLDGVADYLARDEVRRRFVHVGGAVFPLAYLAGLLSWDELRIVYVLGVFLTLVLEFARLVVGLDWWVFRELTREYERSNPAGYALYVVGSTVAVLAFEPAIAVPAVLTLALVDPVSGLLSDNEFREPKRPAVLAVTFAFAGGIALAFVPLLPALLAAAVTTLADGFTPVVRGHAIDDNLSIPIGTAMAMWVGLWLPV